MDKVIDSVNYPCNIRVLGDNCVRLRVNYSIIIIIRKFDLVPNLFKRTRNLQAPILTKIQTKGILAQNNLRNSTNYR